MKNPEKKKLSSPVKIALIVLCVLLAVALVIVAAGAIYLKVTLGKIKRSDTQPTFSSSEIEEIINSTDPVDPEFTGPTYSADDITVPEETAPVILNGAHIVNILLVGQDTRSEQRARSDSMILCTIDTTTNTLTLTSFMRDMYLNIPDYGMQRINVAYFVGGFPMLYETLSQNFGVVVDYGIEVDFTAFTEIIDKVGGVDVTLTEGEAERLREQGFDAHEGVNHMDGAMALAHSRNRATGGTGDFARTRRQRDVVKALLAKAATMDIPSLLDLVDTMIPAVTTDMTNQEIISVATTLAPLISQVTLSELRIPADGTYQMAMVDGMSVLLPDFDANRQLLAAAIGD